MLSLPRVLMPWALVYRLVSDKYEASELVTAAAAAGAAGTATATAAVAAAAASAAASTTAAAAVAAATAAGAATASAAAAAAFTRAGLVDNQGASADIAAIDGGDCLLRFVFGRHFDEPKAASFAGVAVGDDLRGSDVAGFGEQLMELLVGGLIAQIADIEFGCHNREWLLSSKAPIRKE